MTTSENPGWINKNKWFILILVAVLGGVTFTTKTCTFDGSKVKVDTSLTHIDTVVTEEGDTLVLDTLK